jgi:hypothetical protein
MAMGDPVNLLMMLLLLLSRLRGAVFEWAYVSKGNGTM